MIRRVRLPLGLARVPRPYDPGYPTKLAPEELAELLMARTELGPLRVAAMLALLAGLAKSQESAPTSAPTRASREEAVLKVLNEISVGMRNDSWFFWTTKAEKNETRGDRSRHTMPRVPIVFGNSFSGLIDANLARSRARRLFEAYGVAIESNVVFDRADVRGILDGYSETSRMGFEITDDARSAVMAPPRVAEDAGTGLSAAEVGRLETENRKILHVRRSDYASYDSDQVVPQSYWAAAVIEFLNSATDGPDIDLGKALWGDYQVMPLSEPHDAVTGKVVSTEALERRNSPRVLNLGRPTTVRFAVGSAEKHDVELWRRDSRGRTEEATTTQPSSTVGRLSGLHFADFQFEDLGDVSTRRSLRSSDVFSQRSVRLEQTGADGLKRSFESPIGTYFYSPSWFDAARPFTLEVALPVGRQAIPSHLAVTR